MTSPALDQDSISTVPLDGVAAEVLDCQDRVFCGGKEVNRVFVGVHPEPTLEPAETFPLPGQMTCAQLTANNKTGSKDHGNVIRASSSRCLHGVSSWSASTVGNDPHIAVLSVRRAPVVWRSTPANLDIETSRYAPDC